MPDRATDLLARYCSIGLDPPPWAYPLPPSIPFVGRDYGRWGGLLVYASAENLAYYVRRPDTRPAFLQDDCVHDRHRASFEQNQDGFFPNVHLALNDGGLLVASWYYVWCRHGEVPDNPKDLLESIAAANFCKFSIADDKNRDYAGDRTKLAVSLPHVRADLSVLKPRVVILPRTIWRDGDVRDAFREIIPDAEVLPLPQFNPRVVHIYLKEHAAAADQMQRELEGASVSLWIAQMRGYAQGAPYRFLVEMDRVMCSATPPSSPSPISPP